MRQLLNLAKLLFALPPPPPLPKSHAGPFHWTGFAFSKEDVNAAGPSPARARLNAVGAPLPSGAPTLAAANPIARPAHQQAPL